MNIQLSQYISDNLAKGISRQVIEQQLAASGWQKTDIEANFPQQTTKSESPSNTNLMVKLKQNRVSLLLRIGLAFSFIYPAIFISHPSVGGNFVPYFISAVIPLDTFLLLFTVFEWVLAIWILSGKFKMISGLIAAVLISLITIVNFEIFSLLFRNIPVIAAALAFAFL